MAGSVSRKTMSPVAGSPVGGQRQHVDRRTGHLLHRGALDRDDGLFLGAPVPVTEVGERGGHGVEHGDDLEGDQEQRARDEVLQRDGAPGQVDVEDQRGHRDEDRQADPALVGRSAGSAAQTAIAAATASGGDLEDQPGRGAGPVGAEAEPGRLLRRRGGWAVCEDLGLRHVGLLPRGSTRWTGAAEATGPAGVIDVRRSLDLGFDGLAGGGDGRRGVGAADDRGLRLAQRVPDRRHGGDARHDLRRTRGRPRRP